MKFLTLNLFQGKCLEEVISFINEEQFDIVQMQEVAGEGISFTNVDCFEAIKRGTGLKGELLVSWNNIGDKKAYFGNATFYKPSLVLKEREDLRFKKEVLEINFPEDPPPDHPRSALFLKFEKNGKEFWCVNTHLAWGPTPYDEPYKLKDAQLLASKMATLQAPFILSGDFNVIPDTEVVKTLEPFGRNLTAEYALTNTLNPHIHKAKHLFPPGFAVDYIFVHPQISVNHFELLETRELSDHIGLLAELVFPPRYEMGGLNGA